MENMRNRGRRQSDRKIEAYYELMKVAAESSRERMFEYYAESDEAYLLRIQNGKEIEEAYYPDFKQNIEGYLAGCPADSIAAFQKIFDKCLTRSSRTGAQLSMPGDDGKPKLTRLFMVSIPDLNGNVSVVVGLLLDIEDEKGQLDSLTGVYNHISFEDKCVEIIKESTSQLLFMMLDVDDFKLVNDTLGHNVGDLVLSQTGKTLKKVVGSKGVVGRLGGDEFAVLIYGIEGAHDIAEFCNNLNRELKNIIFDMEYSASIGISARDGRNMTFKDLYYEADQAMYHSKKNGKNQITFFNEIVTDEDKKSESESVIYSNYGEANLLSEYERYSDDESPEYILVVDVHKNRILFANKAARRASILPPVMFDDFIARDMPAEFLSHLIRNKEQGYRITVFSCKESPDSVLAQMFGEKLLLIKLTHPDKSGYRKIRIIDLSNITQLNESMRLISSFKTCMISCVSAFNNMKEDSDFGSYLHILKEFYNADLATIIYGKHDVWDNVEEVHNPNSEIMSKVLRNSVAQKTIVDFGVLFNRNGRVLIGNIKDIQDRYPKLYRRLVDIRIWSVFAVKLERDGKVYGCIVLFNPRSNSGELNVLDMIGISSVSRLFYDEKKAEFEYRLNYDEVTGLRKRKTFDNLGESYVEYDSVSMGIFATDIISLSRINNKFGYTAGNESLKKVADALKAVFNGYDIYRYEQDEMMVFCRNIEKKDFLGLVRLVREKLDELDVAVSTGFSWTQKPNLSTQLDEVRRMYERDKESKLHTLSDTVSKRVFKDIVNEINAGRFIVYYQPKVDSRTGITVGAEALIRFSDEVRGLIGPIHFIQILEENKCSHLTDLYVLREVCHMQRERLDTGKRVVPVSVNFSKTTLEYAGLLDEIKKIMDQYELPEGLIQIEITESVGDMDHVVVGNIAQALISMGFKLAMDDFGTKYSNLEMLFKFPFSIAKIDRSLVKDIIINEKSRIMLKHLVSMIGELGIDCVAEGAETREQVELLQHFGCSTIQGYFYSKPVPQQIFTDDFVDKIQESIVIHK